MPERRPLNELKIVITRPRDQSVEFARCIEQAGGIPVLFPLLDVMPVQDSRTLREQIARLAQFDLAIFISPNAVRYGMMAIRTSAPLPASLKIATVGQGSAKALGELGVTDVIVPTERFDSEGLLALPELQQVSGWHVLIFRGDGGRELLGDTLRARGASVEYATCYHRSRSSGDAATLLAAAPDAITVTSSEALDNLWKILGDNGRLELRDIPLFVQHGRIAERAVQQGWRQVKLAKPGDDGMLASLLEWAAQS